MKLIDILAQELPKRGGWPEGYYRCAQNIHGEIIFETLPEGFQVSAITIVTVGSLAEDFADEEVTREQYEAALKQSVWDGTGLPPVGVECEYRFPNVNYRSTFSRGKVLAYGTQKVFMEHWSSKNEFIQPLDNIEFRPIRTERDEAIEEMRKIVTNYNKTDVIHAIEQLYDAGYRKQ